MIASRFDAVRADAATLLKARSFAPAELPEIPCGALSGLPTDGENSIAGLAAFADAHGLRPTLDAPLCQVRYAVLTR